MRFQVLDYPQRYIWLQLDFLDAKFLQRKPDGWLVDRLWMKTLLVIEFISILSIHWFTHICFPIWVRQSLEHFLGRFWWCTDTFPCPLSSLIRYEEQPLNDPWICHLSSISWSWLDFQRNDMWIWRGDRNRWFEQLVRSMQPMVRWQWALRMKIFQKINLKKIKTLKI